MTIVNVKGLRLSLYVRWLEWSVQVGCWPNIGCVRQHPGFHLPALWQTQQHITTTGHGFVLLINFTTLCAWHTTVHLFPDTLCFLREGCSKVCQPSLHNMNISSNGLKHGDIVILFLKSFCSRVAKTPSLCEREAETQKYLCVSP